MPAATGTPPALQVKVDLPESLPYRLKKRLLGPPLVTEQLADEKLTKKLALGVLSSDCISSSAYGSEEMLIKLIPVFGLAAFSVLLPLTGVIIAILILVTLCYRDVVMLYTRAGGCYVVTRDNFGPRVAQVAAVALMLDYIVTVAVQASAGAAAITSLVPSLRTQFWTVTITVCVVLVIFYGNLRGIREAGRAFALPTFLFFGCMAMVIVVGLFRELSGNLPHYSYQPGMDMVSIDHATGPAMLTFLAIFTLLKAFANGGSSLTGLEAISDGVSAFKKPVGPNARRTLTAMSCMLGFCVIGVSWLAHETHAWPYIHGTPTVISQVAKGVLGDGVAGHVLFAFVQLCTAMILFTGANTPFNGFPFLANFVAEDQFLPRQLTKRGHRLAFSNGIIVLAVVALALIITTGAHVDKLVAFYAIGVFTGFCLTGFGMTKYYWVRREGRWLRRVIVNFSAGTISGLIVIIFAVVKFTEGAWLVVVVAPILIFALIKMNDRYRAEAKALDAAPSLAGEPNYPRHAVLVLVDSVDLATLRALRYAKSLHPTELRVVHFMIDDRHAAELQKKWAEHPGIGRALEVIECPDRRLRRAAVELAARTAANGDTEVTVLLPRRVYSPLLGRLLHDRTADSIAEAVSKVPHCAATIVPYDVADPTPTAQIEVAPSAPKRITGRLLAAEVDKRMARQGETAAMDPLGDDLRVRARAAGRRAGMRLARRSTQASRAADYTDYATIEGAPMPIDSVQWRQRATVEGHIRSVQVGPISGVPALEAELVDETGGLTLLFYGRRQVAGIEPGTKLRVEGMVGECDGHLAISNPKYKLLGRRQSSGT